MAFAVECHPFLSTISSITTRFFLAQQDHGLRHERYGMRHERHEALLSVTMRHERHVCVTLRHEASRDTNKKASKESQCVTERHERYEASRIVTILSVTSVTKVVSMILLTIVFVTQLSTQN